MDVEASAEHDDLSNKIDCFEELLDVYQHNKLYRSLKKGYRDVKFQEFIKKHKLLSEFHPHISVNEIELLTEYSTNDSSKFFKDLGLALLSKTQLLKTIFDELPLDEFLKKTPSLKIKESKILENLKFSYPALFSDKQFLKHASYNYNIPSISRSLHNEKLASAECIKRPSEIMYEQGFQLLRGTCEYFEEKSDRVVNVSEPSIGKVSESLRLLELYTGKKTVKTYVPENEEKNKEIVTEDEIGKKTYEALSEDEIEQKNRETVSEDTNEKESSENSSEDETDEEGSLSETECESFITSLRNFYLKVKEVVRFDCIIFTDEIIQNVQGLHPNNEMSLSEFFFMSSFTRASKHCAIKERKTFSKGENKDISEKNISSKQGTLEIEESKSMGEIKKDNKNTVETKEDGKNTVATEEDSKNTMETEEDGRNTMEVEKDSGDTMEIEGGGKSTIDSEEKRNLQENESEEHRCVHFNLSEYQPYLWPSAENLFLHDQKNLPPKYFHPIKTYVIDDNGCNENQILHRDHPWSSWISDSFDFPEEIKLLPDKCVSAKELSPKDSEVAS